MVINISIRSKDLYLIAAIFVMLIGASIVIATSGTPLTNGHSYGEIGLPTNCNNGQALIWDNTNKNWTCGSSTSLDIIRVTGRDTGGNLHDMSNYYITITCPADHPKVISGGYEDSGGWIDSGSGCYEEQRFVDINGPSSTNSWEVTTVCFTAHTYALCSK